MLKNHKENKSTWSLTECSYGNWIGGGCGMCKWNRFYNLFKNLYVWYVVKVKLKISNNPI